jgi:Tfp pilus assembly protein PilN
MMRTHLNLSRQPFTNHRLFWVGVLVVSFISLWLFLYVSAERTRVSAEADSLQDRIESLKKQAQAIKQEDEKRSQQQQKVVITDEQRMQLASARLLIGRRSLSWNRLIGELEKLVPNDARITSIKIEEVFTEGQDALASIEVKAAGKGSAALTEMMTNVEKSGGPFMVSGQAGQDAPNERNEIPFTLNLIYRHGGGA